MEVEVVAEVVAAEVVAAAEVVEVVAVLCHKQRQRPTAAPV